MRTYPAQLDLPALHTKGGQRLHLALRRARRLRARPDPERATRGSDRRRVPSWRSTARHRHRVRRQARCRNAHPRSQTVKITEQTTLGELQLEASKRGVNYISTKIFPAHERVLAALQMGDLTYITGEGATIAEALDQAFARVDAREGSQLLAASAIDILEPPTEN